MLLFDILPVDLALNKSSEYLNASYVFCLDERRSRRGIPISQELLSKIRHVAQNKKIPDNPYSWFALNCIKAQSERSGEAIRASHALKILPEITNPDFFKLDPDYFEITLPGFNAGVPLGFGEKLGIGLEDWKSFTHQEEYLVWCGQLKKALQMIRNVHEDLIPEMNKLIKFLQVVYSQKDQHGSMSPQNILGTVYLPDIGDHTLIAECLVHESLHQYLTRIEHINPIFSDPISGTEELYYSPWRPEPRPLIMVLHGAFVFTGVAMFYHECAMLNAVDLDQDTLVSRISFRALQIRQALDVLSENNKFSPLGQQLFDILHELLDEIESSEYYKVSADDRMEVMSHKSRYSCDNLKHISAQ